MEQSAIQQYLLSFVQQKDELILQMEKDASENSVPIMDRLGMEFMLQMLRLIAPKSILEIGAAIGYSAIRMASAIEGAQVITIERNQERYEKAASYIRQSKVSERISLVHGDALEVFDEVQQHGMFDVIFIDAAKGQYQRFFELYEPLLRDNGVIITDNLLFHGLVVEENIETRRMRSLIRKIKSYNEWLMTHHAYDTVIFPIGDGVAVSKKKG